MHGCRKSSQLQSRECLCLPVNAVCDGPAVVCTGQACGAVLPSQLLRAIVPIWHNSRNACFAMQQQQQGRSSSSFSVLRTQLWLTLAVLSGLWHPATGLCSSRRTMSSTQATLRGEHCTAN